ncbi:butyrophilin subfamily 1 member A1-like [Rhincodon typus]|uniref:butyrophilin subfamily 1 member A1-like n=1 Tax=Rhincodon typus TaxID=259920 RepID=UPI00202E1CD5|nr:butyrophilin subfamily 1 member A1-like [Rhincodon typus]
MQRMFGWKGLQGLLLIFLLWNYSTLADDFRISCSQYPLVVEVGATAVLECQLIPRLPLKGLEIRWSKDNALVHLYRFGQDENAGQHASYKDRTQLFASEFQNGNVSLKLMQVTLPDNGKYKCFVELEAHGFRDAEAILSVARFGEWPLINLNKYTGNGIQLLCESENWFPPPMVQWSNEKGVIQTQKGQPVTEEPSSVNVKSYIDVTSDSGNTFNCLLKSEMLNKTVCAEFYVPDEFHPKTSVWLYMFLLIFFGILGHVVGLFLFFRKQKRQIRNLRKQPTTFDYANTKSYNEELREIMDIRWKHLGEIRPLPKLAIQRMTDAAACIELDCDTTHPNLLISSDLTTMNCIAQGNFRADSSERVEHRLVVPGKTGFTSGRHYWLVEVDMHSVWDLGVARELVCREGNLPLIPENGYWTIRHDGQKYWANITSPLEIMCKEKLQRIGIYVNYNAGQVLFCDGAAYSHLHSFTCSFQGMIYPFFSLSGSGKCSILPSITPLPNWNH